MYPKQWEPAVGAKEKRLEMMFRRAVCGGADRAVWGALGTGGVMRPADDRDRLAHDDLRPYLKGQRKH